MNDKSSTSTDAFAVIDAHRAKLLPAILSMATEQGWSQKMLEAAGQSVGLNGGLVRNAFPHGAVDAIDAWAYQCDDIAMRELAEMDIGQMSVRQRVASGVRVRIEAIGQQHRQAAQRARARLLFPDAGSRGARILWRAADRIWRGIGDQSTDGNYYSKRAILFGVLASTHNAWLITSDANDAWAVLDQRIADVMQIEKAKGRWRKVRAQLPDPLALMSQLRYGRD